MRASTGISLALCVTKEATVSKLCGMIASCGRRSDKFGDIMPQVINYTVGELVYYFSRQLQRLSCVLALSGIPQLTPEP